MSVRPFDADNEKHECAKSDGRGTEMAAQLGLFSLDREGKVGSSELLSSEKTFVARYLRTIRIRICCNQGQRPFGVAFENVIANLLSGVERTSRCHAEGNDESRACSVPLRRQRSVVLVTASIQNVEDDRLRIQAHARFVGVLNRRFIVFTYYPHQGAEVGLCTSSW